MSHKVKIGSTWVACVDDSGQECIPYPQGNDLLKSGFGNLLVFLAGFNAPLLFAKYADKFIFKSGRRRLKPLELAGVLAANFIDDAGTATGFQATEEPRLAFEKNLVASRAIEWFVESGIAKTHSQAFLFMDLLLQASVLFWHFRGVNKTQRIFMYITAINKTLAGYGWWTMKPNEYGLTSYFHLLAGQGRATPERMFGDRMIDFNDENFPGWLEELIAENS